MNRISTLILVAGCMFLSPFEKTFHPHQVEAFSILSSRKILKPFVSNTRPQVNASNSPTTRQDSIDNIMNAAAAANNNDDDNDNDNLNPKRKKQNPISKRRKLKTALASLAIYSTVMLRTPNVAHANHPLENAPTGRISLKPGATLESMQQELELRNELTIEELAKRSAAAAAAAASGGGSSPTNTNASHNNSNSNSNSNNNLSNKQVKKNKSKSHTKKQSSNEYDDEYESFEDDEDDESSIFSKDTITTTSRGSSTSSSSTSAMDLSTSNVAKTVTKFSGSAPVMSSKTKNQQVAKTVVKIMGPIFVFCFARETIRWNREQRNVDKGIEIMEQQRREYLNMKKEEEDDGDDDDDDSDEDDSDEDDEDDDSDDEDDDE